MVMNRMVLAELEGFKAVNDDSRRQSGILHAFPVKEQAVSSEASEMTIDGFGANA
jgi:hypothetical protein